MDAFAVNQAQHVAVLHEKGHGRTGFPLEHPFQVLRQRETGTFHFVGGVVAAKLGSLDKLLRQRFHGAHHLGRCAETNHLQRSDGLVQLLARNAQLAGVQVGQVGAARKLGVAHKAAHGLGGPIQ